MKDFTLSVLGLGKLGSPIAACFAAKGYRVIGVDRQVSIVRSLNQLDAPVFEPGLQELLQLGQGRLRATLDEQTAVSESSATFIVLPTPSEADGGFSLRYVLPACETIGEVLRHKTDHHLVVLTSTVMPGSTAGPVRETLERVSGKRCGRDFGLCYSPEFIALGSVIRDFLNPDFILIGESDPRSGHILEGIYKSVCDNNPPIARMNIVNAEITKISLNSYITTKISFANMLSRICENIPEADVDVVTGALGLDTRIGSKYLKGAISYGGPCFPRDNIALAALARMLGAPCDIAETTGRFNRAQVSWLADLVFAHLNESQSVGILGLTYKPHTDVVEEAAGLLLGDELAARGASVVAFDPAGNRNAAARLEGRVRIAGSAEECIEESEVVVVTTPWPEFARLRPEVWARRNGSCSVIDCWNILGHLHGREGIGYIGLGKGPQTVPMATRTAEMSSKS